MIFFADGYNLWLCIVVCFGRVVGAEFGSFGKKN